MKDLADDDVLQEIFSELIDGRYGEYEKAFGKVMGRMDKIEVDLEQCFDNYEYMIGVKKRIATTEQKLDRIYGLMEENLFNKDDDVTEQDVEEVNDVNSEKQGESNQNNKIDDTKSAFARENENKSKCESQNLLQAQVQKPVPMSSRSTRKVSLKRSNKNSSNTGMSALKLNALKIMFVELETKIDEINLRLKERESHDQIITNATNEISDSLGDSGLKKGMMSLEFQGMKQLVGRQQMSIMK